MNCTPITRLPAAITVPGIYCFTGNLSTSMTSGIAIEIRTSNVVLDLNGFELSGLDAAFGRKPSGFLRSTSGTSQ